MRPQFQPLLRPLEWSEVAPLERVFEGDPKGSHYSIEHDLSLFIWPPASIVQRISVPLRKLNIRLVLTSQIPYCEVSWKAAQLQSLNF